MQTHVMTVSITSYTFLDHDLLEKVFLYEYILIYKIIYA